MQNSFIWSNKKEERDGGEWLIGVHTQIIPYLSTVTTQDKIRRLLMRVKARVNDG